MGCDGTTVALVVDDVDNDGGTILRDKAVACPPAPASNRNEKVGL